MSKSLSLRRARCMRVRTALKKNSSGRLRLSVFRSSKQIYAQIIDDSEGRTLISASTLEKEFRAALDSNGGTIAAARSVGLRVAEKALKQGIERIVFDRGSYMFHGRVKALADGAREAGLRF